MLLKTSSTRACWLINSEHADPFVALHQYDSMRVEATTRVVHANRTEPPDAILREIYQRTGDQPFDNIADIIPQTELHRSSRATNVPRDLHRNN